MNLKKKCQVVMLSTNDKKAPILSYLNDKSLQYFTNEYWSNDDLTKRHLYFLSDEEIKEGDWCVLNLGKNTRVVRVKSLNSGHSVFTIDIEEGYAQLSNLKKIIATTDKSLNLSEPSPSFIQKYVEEWNKGNKITEVMVEYEYIDCEGNLVHPLRVQDGCGIKIKVDKNNQITITKVKDSWSREEVIEILHKLIPDTTRIDQWIEDNL